jgi:hypothetical protein
MYRTVPAFLKTGLQKKRAARTYKPSSEDVDDEGHFCMSGSDFLTRIKIREKKLIKFKTHANG